MEVLEWPFPMSDNHTHEIARSLKRKDTVVIEFAYFIHQLVPGAIVEMEKGRKMVVCWVSPAHCANAGHDHRAGLMPLPEGHTGPWTADHGWRLGK